MSIAFTRDERGVPVSYVDPNALDLYEQALLEFQSYVDDPVQTIDQALAEAPDFVLGHVFRATMLLLTSEAQYLPEARAGIERAESLDRIANDRERGLTAAARCWLEGDLAGACRAWERVLVEHPRDAFALQAAHLTDFYRGDASNLCNRVARVLPAWSESMPGYSYVLGMHAFGLEECNHYDRAEAVGRRALALEPRDGWAVHAVTHVMEMQARFEEGAQWLLGRVDDWAPDNGFAFHNWWHLALFYIERENYAEALRVYDHHLYPQSGDLSMQLLDASALLWRLRLFGADVGDRWQRLAGDWLHKAPTENGYYAFNDVHALMAFIGVGDRAAIGETLEALHHAASAQMNQAPCLRVMADEVGLPVARALLAFNDGRYDKAIDILLEVRDIAHRFGGSHAQRDILNLTLIEAAVRGGRHRLAEHLLNERTALKPRSPLAWRLMAQARRAVGNETGAHDADERARCLSALRPCADESQTRRGPPCVPL